MNGNKLLAAHPAVMVFLVNALSLVGLYREAKTSMNACRYSFNLLSPSSSLRALTECFEENESMLISNIISTVSIAMLAFLRLRETTTT